MTDAKAMSQAQADALDQARETLETLEGRVQMACTMAVKAIQFATDATPTPDAEHFRRVKVQVRNLVAWTAEYCKEREQTRGLEQINTKLYEAWAEATAVLESVRTPAEEEHGNYPSLHYALDSLVKKVYEFVTEMKKSGEGGIDKRWFPDKA